VRELRLDDSTNVRRLTWREDNTLEIEFTSGAIYKYQNVQKHQFESAAGSDSVGAFVQKTFVRNATAYPFTKLKSGEEAKADAEESALKGQLEASLDPTFKAMKAALESIADDRLMKGDPRESFSYCRQVAKQALGRKS
jgi:hypothetical protein